MIVVIRRQRKERKIVVVSAVVVTVMKMSGKRRAVLGESFDYSHSFFPLRFPFSSFKSFSFSFSPFSFTLSCLSSIQFSLSNATSLTAISLKINLRTCMYTHTRGSIARTCYVYTSIGICICKYLYIYRLSVFYTSSFSHLVTSLHSAKCVCSMCLGIYIFE